MRLAAAICLVVLVGSSCSDDRVTFARGPLGPARYEIDVRASGEVTTLSEHRSATLAVSPRPAGAAVTLHSSGERVIQADLQRLEDGTLVLKRVRGAQVDTTGHADLGSLVGQLDPPLPGRPVRLGDTWSSTQRISTDTLTARVYTKLRIVRYLRIAGTDAAELEGEVAGRLSTQGESGIFQGSLRGRTRIAWSVGPGRVASADTNLIWTLNNGNRVVLDTQLRPA